MVPRSWILTSTCWVTRSRVFLRAAPRALHTLKLPEFRRGLGGDLPIEMRTLMIASITNASRRPRLLSWIAVAATSVLLVSCSDGGSVPSDGNPGEGQQTRVAYDEAMNDPGFNEGTEQADGEGAESGSTATQSAAPVTFPESGSQSAPASDPCALLYSAATAEQITAALAGPIDGQTAYPWTGEAPGPITGRCEIQTRSDTAFLVSGESSGKVTFRVTSNQAESTDNEGAPLSGIGDEAYWVENPDRVDWLQNGLWLSVEVKPYRAAAAEPDLGDSVEGGQASIAESAPADNDASSSPAIVLAQQISAGI